MSGQPEYDYGYRRGWQESMVAGATRPLPQYMDGATFDAGYRQGWNDRIRVLGGTK